MDTTALAGLLATGRLGIGAMLVAAPRWTARRWLGTEAGTPATATAVRALGAREVALGLGALAALADDRPGEATGWLVAGVAGDLVDAVATATSDQPRLRRLPVTALALGGAVGGTAVVADLASGARRPRR